MAELTDEAQPTMTISGGLGRFGIVQAAVIERLRGKGTAMLVYCVLAAHADRSRGSSWKMSRKQIAEEAGISPTSVPAVLKALTDAGVLRITHTRTPNGGQGWSHYQLPIVVHRGVVEELRGGSSGTTTPLPQDYTLTYTSTDSSNHPLLDSQDGAVDKSGGGGPDLNSVLDQAAERIVEHREMQGFGVGGKGAIAKARQGLNRQLAEQWLSEGHTEYEVARSLAARVTDGTNSSPAHLSAPPEPEEEPETLEKAREAMGR